MKVSYKREMRHNHMILEAMEEDQESYEFKMLEKNTIEGLLRFRVKQGEQGRYYYYEITSKQPLSRLLGFKEIKKDELCKLILGIGNALDHIEDHLLQESNILLEPEYIYIEPESYQVWLCYVPGYHGDLPSAMEKLLQFLLKKADHGDNDTVVLAYRLYQESQKDHYGMGDLLRAVRESQRGGTAAILQELGSADEPSDMPALMIKKPEDSRQEGVVKEEMEESFWSEGETGEEISCAKDRKDDRQRARFAVLAMISFLVVVPAVVWLFTGQAGWSRYKYYIATADVVIAAGTLILLQILKAGMRGSAKILEGKKRGGLRSEKEQEELQAKWYMSFAEDGEGAETEKSTGETDGPKTVGGSFGMEGLGGNGTVLLAEAVAAGEGPRLLKSLDPSVEDIPIPYFPFIIGKQEGIVDYIVKKDTVSRLHLRLDEEDGGCRVTDLNSSNGTMVAGHDLEANESYPIQSGDKLQIADLAFVFY